MRHTFSIWRTKPGDDFQLWAKCGCGYEVFARTYDDLSVLVRDHRLDAHTLEQLDREEQQHA